jgi:hypothetical protein
MKLNVKIRAISYTRNTKILFGYNLCGASNNRAGDTNEPAVFSVPNVISPTCAEHIFTS